MLRKKIYHLRNSFASLIFQSSIKQMSFMLYCKKKVTKKNLNILVGGRDKYKSQVRNISPKYKYRGVGYKCNISSM